MKIGELAGKTGTSVETIRFYERQFLLPEPVRTSGNYRDYETRHVSRLAFIRHCRSLDMTLDEIRLLLRFKDEPSERCEEVNGLLDDHIGHVVERIKDLKALEQQLKELREQCQPTDAAQECGILQELTKVSNQPKTRKPSGRVEHVGHVHGSHGRSSG